MATASFVEAPPLRAPTKFSYGMGSFAAGVAFVGLIQQTLNFYLNRVVGLAPLVVGVVILVSLIIDGVLDPLIGQWSDNLRTRLGRRHPFMYVSPFLWALAFLVLWNPPHALSGASLITFTIGLLVAVRLSESLYDIPSNALTPELAPHYDQRTSLIAYRFFFLIAGIVVMQQVLGHSLRNDPLYAPGYAQFGTVGAVLILITAFASAAGTHSRIRYLHEPPVRTISVRDTLREMIATLSNPALIILLLSAVLGGAAAGMRTTLDNYFYYYLWGLGPKDVANLGLWGGVGTIAAVLAAPVLSRLLGKKMTMIWFFVASTVIGLVPLTLKLMDLMPPASSHWLFPILALDAFVTIGLALSGLIVVGSMVADVAEDNTVKTGRRSEGLLFATNGLVPKVTAGIGGLFANVLLAVVALPKPGPHVVVPVAMVRHLGWLFLPTYVVIVSVSILVLIFYRIDRSAHEHNLEKMREAAALAMETHAVELEQGAAP